MSEADDRIYSDEFAEWLLEMGDVEERELDVMADELATVLAIRLNRYWEVAPANVFTEHQISRFIERRRIGE